MYILSSEEAYQKFITNPRPYLLPPMPRFPCRVTIIGPPQAGTSTLCKLLAESYDASVLDMDELLKPVLSEEEEAMLIKLKLETTQAAIEKIKRDIEEGVAQASGEMIYFMKRFCVTYRSVPLPALKFSLVHSICTFLACD